MIPLFPNFKPLELSDKEDIENYTKHFPPYSDFNFVSMWSWDIKGEMRISDLNGNLVVKFTDYITDEPFYSLFGDKNIEQSIDQLFQLAQCEKIKDSLFLLPEHCIKEITGKKYLITEDPNNFDYIYHIEELVEHRGKKFISHRNKINKFLREYPLVQVEVLDLTDSTIQQKILSLDHTWAQNKTLKDSYLKYENEMQATSRLFNAVHPHIMGIGVCIGDTLVGYTIFSVLDNNHAISHFTKANIEYKGVYEYLIKESAHILEKMDCHYLNHEQDLGLEGLRKNKKGYVSSHFKKYIVSLNE